MRYTCRLCHDARGIIVLRAKGAEGCDRQKPRDSSTVSVSRVWGMVLRGTLPSDIRGSLTTFLCILVYEEIYDSG